MFYTTFYSSPLGRMTLASDGTNLVGAWFETQKHYEAHMPQHTAFTDDLFIFRQAKHWLDVYFGGDCPDFSLLLNPVGSSPFRTYVWQILQQIPYGQTITYGDIAKKLQLQTGKRVSAQAVGGAVGHNPISVIVPCHRVMGANGNLTGYAGGLKLKIALLKLEGVNTDEFHMPKKPFDK